MKIAILSFYNGLVDRGVETWAKSIKEKLGDKFDIKIISGEDYRKKIDWQNDNNFYWSFLVLRHAVSNLKEWTKADIVVAANGTFQSLFCRLVTWVLGKPLIIFGHSGLGGDDKFNLLCSPNVFVAFSKGQANWAKKHKFPWTKVVVIHHAVDLVKFTPARTKPKKRIVLCVAANIPSKRVELVEKAVGLLPKYKFVGIGKGSKKEVAHELIPREYRDADVFCFVPHPWEAFGLVFLEAMACNLPVVTIDDPIRREIIGDAGAFVVNPEDIQALAVAIKTVYDKKWGDIPRRQAKKFSWEKISDKYVELFKSLQ